MGRGTAPAGAGYKKKTHAASRVVPNRDAARRGKGSAARARAARASGVDGVDARAK